MSESSGDRPDQGGVRTVTGFASPSPETMWPKQLFIADYAFVDRRFIPDAAVLVDGAGRIVAAGRRAEVASRLDAANAVRHELPGCALIPGCVNSHTHTFQVLLRGNGDNAANFR